MAFISLDDGVLINTNQIVAILPTKSEGSSLCMVDGRVFSDSQRTPEQLAGIIARQPSATP